MTNVIYKCELLKDPSDTETIDIEADAILIRLYGDGTEAFFDRQEELTVFSSLANLKYGSHALLCQFENGRCERFFTGSETLTIEELCNKDKWINGAMGREVAIFHSLPVFETTPSYNQVVHDFLDTVRHCYNGLVENSKSTWFDKNGVLLQAKKEESKICWFFPLIGTSRFLSIPHISSTINITQFVPIIFIDLSSFTYRF